MKAMQGGMATMNTIGGAGMAGMGAMQAGKPMPGDMNQRQQMMENRMDRMHSMTQMMIDRMPVAPAQRASSRVALQNAVDATALPAPLPATEF